jgi:surfactin synthase thioesterase subunit
MPGFDYPAPPASLHPEEEFVVPAEVINEPTNHDDIDSDADIDQWDDNAENDVDVDVVEGDTFGPSDFVCKIIII